MLEQYLPIAVLGIMAVGLGLAVLALSMFIGPRRPTPVKSSTYESGLSPIGPARRRVSVRFYLIATLFILFDIEVIYLYPWAVNFRKLALPAPAGQGMGALVSMGVFLLVLLLGYIYVWRKRALEWD